MQSLLRDLTHLRAAMIVLIIASATIIGALVFERAGYAPCDLCLKQRWAYYAGVPVAALAVLTSLKGPHSLSRIVLLLLALIFAGSAAFGIYHAGVEWGFWPGPAGCTSSSMPTASSMDGFMKQLQTTKVVRCDEVALRIAGISLAGWNAIISAGMSAIAFAGSAAKVRR